MGLKTLIAGMYDKAAAAVVNLATGVTGVLRPQNGGTGIANNSASTLTISGNFGTTVTVSGATTVTLPTTGTLLSSTTQVLTTLTTEQMRLRYDASNYLSGTVDSGGSVIFNTVGAGAITYSFKQNGSNFVFFGANSIQALGENNGIFCTGDGFNFSATRCRLGVDVNLSLGSGLGCAATGTVTLLSGGTEIGRWTASLISFVVPIVLASYTVATLPAAATAGAGATAFVTDASTTIILGLGLTVVGGGANKVPVYSDGSAWKIG